MKNRLILCLLICGVLLYYAVPRLSVFAPGAEGIFAMLWILLAIFVIAGNLAGYLFAPKVSNRRRGMYHSDRMRRKRVRSYNG